MKKLLLPLLFLLSSGCTILTYEKPDGSKFTVSSLFSNTAFKGLVVDGTTRTTTNGLRITAGTSEPNAESITASGQALGELIGTAAKAAAK